MHYILKFLLYKKRFNIIKKDCAYILKYQCILFNIIQKNDATTK